MLAAHMGTGAVEARIRLERAPQIRKRARRHGQIVDVIQFTRWACEQHNFPSVEAVRNRFGVSRATAYRWTRALAIAYDMDPQWRHWA